MVVCENEDVLKADDRRASV